MRKLPPFPVLLPLLGLCLVPSLLHATPAPRQRSTVAASLGIWQLRTRAGAKAVAVAPTTALAVAPTQGFQSAFALEPQADLRIALTPGGDAAESVVLSNAIEVAPSPASRHFLLRFRLRTTSPATIPLTLRSAGAVVWSGTVTSGSAAREVCLPVRLAHCTTAQVLLSLSLGAQRGVVSVADLRLEPALETPE